jgi:integrase
MARGRKLGYGEGSVYWDESVKRWRGAATIDGRRHRVSGLTKAEATEALGSLRDRVNSGKPAEDTTVGEWIAWWLENVGAPREDSGEATRENYKWALDQTAAIWGIELSELRAADVNRMLGKLATRKSSKPGGRGGRQRPLSESSLRRVRFSLGVVLDAAIADGRIGVNVANPKVVRVPTTARHIRPRRSLSTDEGERLMDAARHATDRQGARTDLGKDAPESADRTEREAALRARLEALVGVMLWCGLRPGEVTGLTWDCIDLTNETMAIRQSRKKAPGPKGVMSIGDTKAKSDRTFRIPNSPAAPVVDLLVEHKHQQKKQRLAAQVWEYEDLVFTNAIGDFIDPSNLRREIARLCEDAGIRPAISPNELRHTTTTLLRHAGVAPRDIADMLGQRDERMFDQHYFDRRAERVIDLTEAQGRMLSG